MIQELINYIKDQQNSEMEQDLADDVELDYQRLVAGIEDDSKLAKMLKDEDYRFNGGDIWQIEDEQQFKEAYIKWVVERYPLKMKKGRFRIYSIFRKLHRKLKRESPEYAAIADHFADVMEQPHMASTITPGKFLPDKADRHAEIMRLGRENGRYVPGFRHYENFYNYKLKFPDATIDDYSEDMESPITLEEFMKLTKAAFIYQVKVNPVVYHRFKLDSLQRTLNSYNVTNLD